MRISKFGVRLRRLLSERGISQGELARRAGLSPPMVSRYVRGHVRVSLETAKRIAVALGVGYDAILGRPQPKEKEVPRG